MDLYRDLYEIQLLKARYLRYMDTKQWDEWRQLFTEDLEYYIDVSWRPESTTPTFKGADELLAYMSKSLPSKITVHQCHMPEIEFVDENTATGVWALFSWTDEPSRNFAVKNYGHYHERYVRGDDGKWRIASIHLTRLRQNNVDPLPSEPRDVIDRDVLGTVKLS
jgi:SnoaL-like domain